MISIKGIYKIPAARHAFFIVPSLDSFGEDIGSSQESKKRMEYFEHILQLKDHMPPKVIPRWKLKLMSEDDFLSALKQQIPTRQVSSNPSSHNPEDLELLAINLVETPENPLDWTFNTPKVLCAVPDEDIIEVFI